MKGICFLKLMVKKNVGHKFIVGLFIFVCILLIQCNEDCLIIKYPVRLMDAKLCIPYISNCRVKISSCDDFEGEYCYYHVDSCNDLFIEIKRSFYMGNLVCSKNNMDESLTELNEENYEFLNPIFDYCDENYNLEYEKYIDNSNCSKGIKIWQRNINRSKAVIWMHRDNYIARIFISFKHSEINKIKKLFNKIKIIY